eukprot:13647_1
MTQPKQTSIIPPFRNSSIGTTLPFRNSNSNVDDTVDFIPLEYQCFIEPPQFTPECTPEKKWTVNAILSRTRNNRHPLLQFYKEVQTGRLPLPEVDLPNWSVLPCGDFQRSLVRYGLSPLEVLDHFNHLKWKFWSKAMTQGISKKIVNSREPHFEELWVFANWEFSYYPKDVLQIIVDDFYVYLLNSKQPRRSNRRRSKRMNVKCGSNVLEFRLYMKRHLLTLLDWDQHIKVLYDEKAYYMGIFESIDNCVLHPILFPIICSYLYELYGGYLTSHGGHVLIPSYHPWSTKEYPPGLPLPNGTRMWMSDRIQSFPHAHLHKYFKEWTVTEWNCSTKISWDYKTESREQFGLIDSIFDGFTFSLCKAKQDVENVLESAWRDVDNKIVCPLDATYQYRPRNSIFSHK